MTLKQEIKRLVPDAVIQRFDAYQSRRRLPSAARLQHDRDGRWVLLEDPGSERVLMANLAWISRAQACSTTADGGVARHYSLVTGWSPSYPETTGYIVPTMLAEASVQGDDKLRQRAEAMLHWLIDIQLPDGGYQGGMVTQRPVVPVTFNTGQILLGLAAGARFTDHDACLQAMHQAARWLVDTMDDDGCWRRFATPFAAFGEKAYETHVAWGLFEADRAAPGQGYGEAGLKQVRWALGKQQANGWFEDCCLSDPTRPLTHTLGYALRGVLEAYRLSDDPVFLEAGRRTADALMQQVRNDGFLAGRFDSTWQPAVNWSCLTGSVQLAFCWFQLFEWTDDARYLAAGQKVNAFVRRTVAVQGDPDVLGAVRGSYPISGLYGRYEYLNWAAKFSIDALRKEIELTSQGKVN